MSKPTAGSAPLRWGTVPLIPADLTEPDTTHMDEGWQDAEEPPHSYFNYWMNLVYLWLVYLDNITAEALTWTALETFNLGIVAANPNGAGLSATSTFAVSGVDFSMTDWVGTVKGVATISDGGFGAGVFGVGPNGNSLSAGVGGLGGTATGISAGGWGGWFTGGARTTSGAVGGAGWGVRGWGGFVNGSVNTAVAAGAGGDFHGGDVLSDANGRRGGQAIRVSGGIGQAGYGHAIEVLSGDVNFAGGANTNLTMGAGSSATIATLSVTGNETIGGTLSVTGLLTAVNNLTVGNVLTVFNLAVTNAIAAADAVFSGDIEVHGTAQFDSTTTFGATASMTTVTASGNVQGSSLTSTGSGSSIPMPNPTTVTYLNSWATANTSPVQYWKDAFGMIHLHGNMGTGTAGTVAFNLPAGFRPSVLKLMQIIDSNSASFRLDIATNGDCTPLGSYSTYISLDGLSFRT